MAAPLLRWMKAPRPAVVAVTNLLRFSARLEARGRGPLLLIHLLLLRFCSPDSPELERPSTSEIFIFLLFFTVVTVPIDFSIGAVTVPVPAVAKKTKGAKSPILTQMSPLKGIEHISNLHRGLQA